MGYLNSPAAIGDQRRIDLPERVLLAAQDVHRRIFCFLLALAPAHAVQHEGPTTVARLVARVPFGAAARAAARRRPLRRRIDVSRLLMGGQAGLDSTGFAAAFGTLRYSSTPMDQSPHVELLRLAERTGRPLSEAEIMATSYFAFARRLADRWGDFFGATSDAEIVAMATNFIDWSHGTARRATVNSGSPAGDGVLVAKVRGTDTYQVIDGHHRLAVSIAQGARSVRVHRSWLSTQTALQHRLADHADGSARAHTLPQPLGARELNGWPVSRNCEDRLVRIERVAACSGAPRTYLDVGCGFGWYLSELKRSGWQVLGIEADAQNVALALGCHELVADEIVLGDWASSLEQLERRFGVVTCLGLGDLLRTLDDDAAVERTIAALDRATDTALVVEARGALGGTETDARHAGSLTAMLLASSTFRVVSDLGVVRDPAPTAAPDVETRLLSFRR